MVHSDGGHNVVKISRYVPPSPIRCDRAAAFAPCTISLMINVAEVCTYSRSVDRGRRDKCMQSDVLRRLRAMPKRTRDRGHFMGAVPCTISRVITHEPPHYSHLIRCKGIRAPAMSYRSHRADCPVRRPSGWEAASASARSLETSTDQDVYKRRTTHARLREPCLGARPILILADRL